MISRSRAPDGRAEHPGGKLDPPAPTCYRNGMLRLALKIMLAGAALAAVWAFVPIGGRTMATRWDRAANAGDFVDRTWAELHGPPRRTAQKPRAPQHAQGRAPAGARPSEGHTEADRQELDRILSGHLQD